jgi:hypothetical protein
MERLQLTRQFISTQNPLDFFAAWKTPTERYRPREQAKADAVGTADLLDDDEEEEERNDSF